VTLSTTLVRLASLASRVARRFRLIHTVLRALSSKVSLAVFHARLLHLLLAFCAALVTLLGQTNLFAHGLWTSSTSALASLQASHPAVSSARSLHVQLACCCALLLLHQTHCLHTGRHWIHLTFRLASRSSQPHASRRTLCSRRNHARRPTLLLQLQLACCRTRLSWLLAAHVHAPSRHSSPATVRAGHHLFDAALSLATLHSLLATRRLTTVSRADNTVTLASANLSWLLHSILSGNLAHKAFKHCC